MFKALLVEKNDEGKTSASVQDISEDQLPEGNVTVAVEYSTVNYKDGLCIGPGGGLVRTYPHVPGIDFAGTVETSDDDRYKPGDKVVLTGWRVGENRWGGYAEKARVSADMLVPLPEGLTTRQAMAVGTAGLTAMLAVMALEDRGLKDGPLLVTGAAGGVGSVATAILANLGHEVAAVTGRPEQEDYLKSLGATQIVAREELTEVTRKPLEAELWGGCVDAVAGAMLGRVLKQMKYGASVAAIGLAGGAAIEGALITPFILRGVNLLGIDSVMQPYQNRVRAWGRIAKDLPMDKLEAMVQTATLSDLPGLGKDILKGQVKGRVVVDVTA
ncbi:MDR family oxidoreductase [Primorskyibacter flagellatus]|uniref:Acrylyl-CoA reductase (NADPH) n=1 Tax=Primorskyibacter flagellatus TaxID=1387277 RepID=A0A1W2E6G2_9RHOB|nr:MDR family oxidoreductase [Primorskyibacter flagellatus]SMD05370.1 acrylyl-CoA reductase (NADPH) [Primorskyibacter flagellatus]